MKKNIKIQQGFIQIPILITIITGMLMVAGGGYFGTKYYEDYQFEKNEIERVAKEKERQNQEFILSQQKALEETQKEVENLKLINQQEKNESVKIKSVSDIVKEWRQRVVLIVCEQIQGGSGTLIKSSDSDMIKVITNKHVIKIDDERLPKYCDVRFPLEEIGTGFIRSVQGSNMTVSGAYDLATLPFEYPNEYTKKITPTQDSICKEKPAIGDSIVILGYPTIGSYEDITATEGIISGYDDEYYITSAKVESGNSGGAAILVKNNCYLGIPTLSVRGRLESLARILDVRVALGLVKNVSLLQKSGIITVFNDSANNQTLLEATRFMGSNGLIYKTQKTVVVSGYGNSEVNILSEDRGYEYELDCSISKPCIFTIPGFKGFDKYNQIYGKAFLPIK